ATTQPPTAAAVIAKVLEEQKNSKESKASKSKKDIAARNAQAAELLSINTELDKESEHDNGPEAYKPLEGSATYTDINAFFGN
ncbi:hypothetical protein ACPXAO_24035, partial [Salmonella enterica]|uniref:hypothetical protein n=1 Tax=Salmonella enterica TaxID=28901 RepID=UPI003CE7E4CC